MTHPLSDTRPPTDGGERTKSADSEQSAVTPALWPYKYRPQAAPCSPVIKWAGGKAQLLEQYRPHLPKSADFGRYYEPFLGGAAVFLSRPGYWASAPSLSDTNEELINFYTVLQSAVEDLILAAEWYADRQNTIPLHDAESADFYYEVRGWHPAALAPVHRAARFLFLNKMCYNGLYRVNKSGRFNVPVGRTAAGALRPFAVDYTALRAVSAALSAAKIATADYREAIQEAQSGDFVFFDPPYFPLKQTSFTDYAVGMFSSHPTAALYGLAETADKLRRSGVMVAIANHDCPEVRRAFPAEKEWKLEVVQARRPINSKGNGRSAIPELLIKGY